MSALSVGTEVIVDIDSKVIEAVIGYNKTYPGDYVIETKTANGEEQTLIVATWRVKEKPSNNKSKAYDRAMRGI